MDSTTDREFPQPTRVPRSPEAAKGEMWRMVTSTMLSYCLAAASELGIADAVHLGPLPFDVLARKVDAKPERLERLVRALAGFGVFTVSKGGDVSNNDLSDTLRVDSPNSFSALARWTAANVVASAWCELAESVRGGDSGTRLVTGTDLFTFLVKNPDDEKTFDRAMTEMSRGVAETVAAGYDFSPIKRLVDIGGGNGLFLGTILKKYPSLEGVLYERPSVVAKAPPILEGLGVADRCDLLSGDFLESVPAGADAYIIKNVLHNWDDERVLRLMQHIHRASVPGGKLFVVEYAPDQESPPHTRLLDMCMMVVTEGGRLRTGDEFRALMGRAGFDLQRRIAMGADGVVLWEAFHRGAA